MLLGTEVTTMHRSELESLAAVHKITWQKAGSVTEPGRYMLRFGWLVITADDLAIWRQYPTASFALFRTANEAKQEYRLGAFELP